MTEFAYEMGPTRYARTGKASWPLIRWSILAFPPFKLQKLPKEMIMPSYQDDPIVDICHSLRKKGDPARGGGGGGRGPSINVLAEMLNT